MRISEALGQFLMIPAQKMEQWRGNMFYRGVQPSEINRMSYHELKGWNDWHEIIKKAEIDAVKHKGV